MKQILLMLIFLPLLAFGQIVNNGPGSFVWVDSNPTHNPGASGSKFAVNRNTFEWWEHVSSTSWVKSGERIQTITGCVPPAYTPLNHQSTIVVNGCDQMYRYRAGAWRMFPESAPGVVAMVADSTAFVALSDTVANIVIMTDTDRGGTFAPCVSCTSDGYMVFTDANGQKWERINYDRILSSWFGRYGHTSLQRAIDYVDQAPDKYLGVLYLNIPYTLKNTVTRKEGVQLRGVSTVAGHDTNGLASPQRNTITIDINNPTKTGIDTEENARGYEVNGGLFDLNIKVISRCSIVVNMREPYKGILSNLTIGYEQTPRLFDYGIAVKGSVVSTADNIFIQGAIKAALLGYYGGVGDFGGGTFKITNSYFTRANIGIEMRSGQSFDLDNVVLENIDSIGIYTESPFSWVNSYTESCPLRTNGAGVFIRSGGDIYDIYINNVFANAGSGCMSGNCSLFSGRVRKFVFKDGKSNNIPLAVPLPDSTQYGVLQGNFLYSFWSDSSALKLHRNWQYGLNAAVSGGTLNGTVNTWKGVNVIPHLSDGSESTGQMDQIPVADGSGVWQWTDQPPSLPSGTSGQTLRHDGIGWAANSYLYNTGAGVGVNTTTITAPLTVAGNADFVASGSRTVNIGRVGGSNLTLQSSTTASILGTTTNTNLEFRTNGLTRFTLDNTGIFRLPITQITGTNNGASTSMLRLYDNLNTQRIIFSDFGNIHMGLGSTDATKYINIIPDGTNSLFWVNTSGKIKSAPLAGSSTGYTQTSASGEIERSPTSWTLSTRPASPFIGQMGYNTETANFEGWTGSVWVNLKDH